MFEQMAASRNRLSSKLSEANQYAKWLETQVDDKNTELAQCYDAISALALEVDGGCIQGGGEVGGGEVGGIHSRMYLCVGGMCDCVQTCVTMHKLRRTLQRVLLLHKYATQYTLTHLPTTNAPHTYTHTHHTHTTPPHHTHTHSPEKTSPSPRWAMSVGWLKTQQQQCDTVWTRGNLRRS